MRRGAAIRTVRMEVHGTAATILCRGFGRAGCFAKRFYNKAGADAAGARVYLFNGAVAHGTQFLNVGLPHLFGFIVRMADVIADLTALAANTACFSHLSDLL